MFFAAAYFGLLLKCCCSFASCCVGFRSWLIGFIKCFVVCCFGVNSLLLSLIFAAYVVILPLVLIGLWGVCVIVSFVV